VLARSAYDQSTHRRSSKGDGAVHTDGYLIAPTVLEAERNGNKRRTTLGADKAKDSRNVVKLRVILHKTKSECNRLSNYGKRTERIAGWANALI
jgi:hypothetical protein